MRPFNAVFDTGSRINIVRQDALTDGWKTWLTKDTVLPTLGDGNGRPLRLLGEIVLRIRLGNTTYRVPFIVADKLAVKLIVRKRFMNRYVDAIECRNQTIRLNWGGTIPILSRHDARRPHESPNDKPNDNNDQNDSPRNDKRINDAPFNKPHTIRTARTVTIPRCPRYRFRLSRKHPDSSTSNRSSRSKRGIMYERQTEYTKYGPTLSSNWF